MTAHIERGGTYYRVCGPDWDDPVDTRYGAEFGGRWNAPGTFGVLYLNPNLKVARANAMLFLKRQLGPGVQPEDVADDYLPDAVSISVTRSDFADAVSTTGRRALGLAARYAPGKGYLPCRAAGARLYREAESGIATTSAVAADHEELAIFDRRVPHLTRVGRRRRFAGWY